MPAFAQIAKFSTISPRCCLVDARCCRSQADNINLIGASRIKNQRLRVALAEGGVRRKRVRGDGVLDEGVGSGEGVGGDGS